MDKVELKKICDDFGFDEKYKNFIEKVGIDNTAQTTKRDQFRVISEFILATSNEKSSNRMFWLTIALVFVGVIQAVATAVQALIQWKQI